MKAIILAGGYATRLYPLTKNQPKPLLSIAGKPIIEYILDQLAQIQAIDETFIVTNAKFYDHFMAWKDSTGDDTITIVNDQTTSNEDRLGAVGDINYVIQHANLDDDLLIIAGDNLFGFSLQDFVDFARKQETSVVAFRDLGSLDAVRNRFGVGILEGSKVIDFEEKPSAPKSALASTACYLIHKQDLQLVQSCRTIDNTGNLIRHLAQQSQVHGFIFTEHWFDVGTHQSLQEAQDFYHEH